MVMPKKCRMQKHFFSTTSNYVLYNNVYGLSLLIQELMRPSFSGWTIKMTHNFSRNNTHWITLSHNAKTYKKYSSLFMFECSSLVGGSRHFDWVVCCTRPHAIKPTLIPVSRSHYQIIFKAKSYKNLLRNIFKYCCENQSWIEEDLRVEDTHTMHAKK